jgi:hypothetical protein
VDLDAASYATLVAAEVDDDVPVTVFGNLELHRRSQIVPSGVAERLARPVLGEVQGVEEEHVRR